MRGQVPWRGRFADWLKAITELKRQWTPKQFRASIERGVRQAIQTGTTTLLDIACVPELLPETPLRLLCFPELMDLGRPLPEWPSRADGLAPHALYTASPRLYRKCVASGLPVTTHLAETPEEEEMFRWGRGPLCDWLRELGRDMSDCQRTGPVELAHELGVLGPRCLAAHMNCLTAHETELVRASGTHVVHCPRTHRFFQRARFPLETYRQRGVNVCLGTDSLASNDSLDMRAEMQELARVFPQLSAEEILAMATVHAAKALHRADRLGTLTPGASADLIALPLDGPVADPYEAVVFAERPPVFSMIRGKVMFG
jgi:cytosine/adenosine deaminase-related metal-dependent hydrolase